MAAIGPAAGAGPARKGIIPFGRQCVPQISSSVLEISLGLEPANSIMVVANDRCRRARQPPRFDAAMSPFGIGYRGFRL